MCATSLSVYIAGVCPSGRYGHLPVGMEGVLPYGMDGAWVCIGWDDGIRWWGCFDRITGLTGFFTTKNAKITKKMVLLAVFGFLISVHLCNLWIKAVFWLVRLDEDFFGLYQGAGYFVLEVG
jgi:hypothetical protein